MSAESISIIASDFETQLSGAITVADTSFTLQSITDKDGDDLPDGVYCFTLDRDNTSAKEYLVGQLTAATKTVSGISSVSAQGTLTANAQKAHRIGANVIISDHSILSSLSKIFRGTGTIDPAVPLEYETNPTLSSSTQLATKGYVDSVVSGGTVNADRIVVGSQTAGETVAAGNVVYYNLSNGRWWKATATTTYINVPLGIALGAGTAGNPVTNGVLLYGKCDSFTGLTDETLYYLSDTAGAVSTTAGTNPIVIGTTYATTGMFVNINSSNIPLFITTSAGAGDAGKGIKTNASGLLDTTFTTTPVRRVYGTLLGDVTTNFDVTNPGGTTFRYTYDGTGTDPVINGTTVPTGYTVRIYSTALTAANSGTFTVTGSGANYFEVTNASGVAEINKTLTDGFLQAYTTTWTKPSDLKYIVAEVVAGGGGGSTHINSGTTDTPGAGGGGGGYASKLIAAVSLGATETIAVGTGGAKGLAGADGGAGGSSSFGSLVVATGGAGGVRNTTGNGGAGGIGTAGDILVKGQGGSAYGGSVNLLGGSGGSSVLGGGAPSVNSDGATGGLFGGGGSGGGGSAGSDRVGGAGAPGVVIVTEYYN